MHLLTPMHRGSVIEGKYEVVRRIGMGGMGAVWEVVELQTGQRLALKTLHEHYRESKHPSSKGRSHIPWYDRTSTHVTLVLLIGVLSAAVTFMLLR